MVRTHYASFMGPFETVHLNAKGGLGAVRENFQAALQDVTQELKFDYPLEDDLFDRLHDAMEHAGQGRERPERRRARDRKLMSLMRWRAKL